MGTIDLLNNCRHVSTENLEITTEDINNDKKVYSGNGIFNSKQKTIITSANKDYKEIDILSFSKRKSKAKELMDKRKDKEEDIIKQALEYDNTLYDIIVENKEFKNFDKLLSLFKKNESKNQFENLIQDIINSDKWDDLNISKKFYDYKNELDNRIKFNQPIEENNECLFFYKSKIHILLNLLEMESIHEFKKKLSKKREVYNELEINNIIKKNDYPKDLQKLKFLMIILIKINNKDIAYFMLNSIYNETENKEYYFNLIKEIEKDKNVRDNSISLGHYFVQNNNIYSPKNIVYSLKKYSSLLTLSLDYLYKYDQFLKNYFLTIYLDEFRKIIKEIFKSKYYETIIKELFQKKQREIDFIQSNEFIDYLLSKINIIPASKETIPFLDKFSLDIYLGGYDTEDLNYYYCDISFRKNISILLKLGKNVVFIIHEGGGNFIYSYFTLISNNYYNLSSPKIKINNRWIQNELGEQVELLLFNRVIFNLTLKEALFLLNTKNHNTYNNFDEFRENFLMSNEKEYNDVVSDFEGPFTNLITKIDWKEIKDIPDFPISISCKKAMNEQPFIILPRIENDTLGKAYKSINSLEYASYA